MYQQWKERADLPAKCLTGGLICFYVKQFFEKVAWLSLLDLVYGGRICILEIYFLFER